MKLFTKKAVLHVVVEIMLKSNFSRSGCLRVMTYI